MGMMDRFISGETTPADVAFIGAGLVSILLVAIVIGTLLAVYFQ